MISAAPGKVRPKNQKLKNFSIRPAARPVLKLISEPFKTTSDSTLRQVFRLHIKDDLEVGESAFGDYNTVITLWEELQKDYPVGEINKALVKEFRTRVSCQKIDVGTERERKRSPATVNKLMRVFKALVRRMWPKDSHNPEGLGLVDYFEFPGPLSEPANLLQKFTFSRKDLSALYRASVHAKPVKSHRRSHLYNALLWQCSLVLSLNCGPRTWDLFSLDWDNIVWDEFKYGALVFCAKKTEKAQRIPLNQVASIHLKAVRALKLDPVKIFPGFKKNKTFYSCWKNICRAADLESMKGRNTRFEDNRKTCSSRYDDSFEGVGAWVTGHCLKGVNAKHYQDATQRVRNAVYKLKQPVAFRKGAKELLAKLKEQQRITKRVTEQINE